MNQHITHQIRLLLQACSKGQDQSLLFSSENAMNQNTNYELILLIQLRIQVQSCRVTNMNTEFFAIN